MWFGRTRLTVTLFLHGVAHRQDQDLSVRVLRFFYERAR